MKKAISTLLAAVTLLGCIGLVGCEQTPPAEVTPSAASTPANKDDSTGAKSPDSTGGELAKATEGELTVYTALEDEQVTAYLEDFNAKYPGIQVNIVRESTGIITAKLLAEKDNPQADVVWGTAASSMMVLDDLGCLLGYAPEGVDRVLPEFKSDKAEPTWVGIDAWETAIIINTQLAAQLNLPEVTSYQDLLDPAFKDQIVMSNPNSSGTGFLTVSAMLQLMGEDEGWAYLEALNENIDQYVHSGSKPAKMAAAGECAVGISFGYAGISQQQKGAPVEVIFPEEGSGWDLEANALMVKDEINPTAYTFLDWAISDSAMELYKVNYPIITIDGVGEYDGYEGNPVDQLIDNDFAWAAANREEILNSWMSRFDGKSAAK